MFPRLMVVIFLFLTALPNGAAQARKASKLYNEGRYAEAIPLFEKLLQRDSDSKYKSRLADCYRKTNQPAKAAELYAQVVQRKHFSPKIMLYYGEVLMNLGRYDEAKTWFLKYAEKKPGDPIGPIKAAACDYVKTIRPYFKKYSEVKVSFNSPQDDGNPFIFGNTIYFSSDRKTGFNVLKKKTDWTGRETTKIYSVDILSDTSFDKPRLLPQKINNINKHVSKPSFTAAGEMYFSKNSSRVAGDHTYKLHLFRTRLLPSGKWEKPAVLPFCQLNVNYLHPSVSPDGKMLFFASNKQSGEGGMDIYVSYKQEGSQWGRPVNLGPVINTIDHEAFPFYHPSGLLFFSSKGHPGLGGFDIFVSRRDEEGNWSEPVNLGPPINSGGDDIGFFTDSTMHRTLFASNRGGDNDDIFFFLTDTAHVTPPAPATDSLAIPEDSIAHVHALPDSTAAQMSGSTETPADSFDLIPVTDTTAADLMEGDTILLQSPTYGVDEFEVPVILRKQLDLLIPEMKKSKDLIFEIYCPNGRPADIFSQTTLSFKRALEIKDYLSAHQIPEKRLKVMDITKTKIDKKVNLAAPKFIYILVKAVKKLE